MAADSSEAKAQASRLNPVISTRLRPNLSASRPAMPLVTAAMIIITENRLPGFDLR